jgi:hypothetical protein
MNSIRNYTGGSKVIPEYGEPVVMAGSGRLMRIQKERENVSATLKSTFP